MFSFIARNACSLCLITPTARRSAVLQPPEPLGHLRYDLGERRIQRLPPGNDYVVLSGARAKPGDGRVAERFELYCCGVELANAFGELTDPAVQRARLSADMAEKERLYGVRWPVTLTSVEGGSHPDDMMVWGRVPL